MGQRRVWITSSGQLARVCDLLPANQERQSLVTSLIKAYGLEQWCEGIVEVSPATRLDLEKFHGKEFVDVLLRPRYDLDRRLDQFDSISLIVSVKYDGREAEDSDTSLELYGLKYDCPVFPFMAEYCKLVAGSSIAAARQLIRSLENTIVINWYGGRHHCFKNRASGFCYVNDIVLAITTLRQRFKKIYYLDIDLHHGDGVESAFEFSKNVMTCSIHRHDVGFFPGTGSLSKNSAYTLNIPTKKGLSDSTMMKLIERFAGPSIEKFFPEALVLQMGCDGLSTDEHKEWNMSIKGYGKVLSYVMESFRNCPIMILGGGGYNHTETAKCWTYLTSIAVGRSEDWDQKFEDNTIPEHPFLDEYEKDGYRFWTQDNSVANRRVDENDEQYLQQLEKYFHPND